MGDIEYTEAVPEYTEHLLKSVNVDAIRGANLRLLVDYDYSQVSSVLPGILNQIGVTTIPLNAGLREGGVRRTVDAGRTFDVAAAGFNRHQRLDG